MDKKTDRIRSYLIIILMLILGVAALIGSIQIYIERPGLADAGMYPLLMSALMVISMLGALWELRQVRKKSETEQEEKMESRMRLLLMALKEEFPGRTVFMGGCILGYGILFHFLGFYVSTAIFMMVSMLGLYRGKKVVMCFCVTAGTLIFINVIIERIFNIPLP